MTQIVAARLDGAIADRTWTVGPTARTPSAAARHTLFLLTAGRAVFAPERAAATQLVTPTLLWLPQGTRGSVQVRAGGDGFTATIGVEFAQRIAADLASGAALRPLLERVTLCGPAAVTPALPALTLAMAALVAESRDMPRGAGAMLGLHMGLILMHLWRAAGSPDGMGARGATSTAGRFRRLIELHYRDNVRVDAFAAMLGVSRAHLHDACVRATGLTPLAMIHERLLAEARARLEQTDLSVEQVGYGIGFRDPGYFSRFFKRGTGMAPGAYRRAQAARSPSAASFAAWP